MVVIGLTGSIGMGKSLTANLFRAAGVAVHDSDAAVHRLYSSEAAAFVESAFPGVTREGVIDRAALARRVFGDERAMKQLEDIVHPFVRADRASFLCDQQKFGAAVAVVDIPLLFETGSERDVDLIVVVDAPEAVQKSRVLARPGMTLERFEAILSRQTPKALKRARAHFIVDSGRGVPFAERQVRSLLRAIVGRARG